MDVSAVLITKNEEANLKRCLESIGFCKEIIVIDDGSTDDTVGIAKSFGAVVFERKLADDFSAQRNFGLGKAKTEWAISIDPDEEVTKELKEEIGERIVKEGEKVSGFRVRRVDTFFGREIKHGESGNAYLLRVIKVGQGEWKRRVHEKFVVRGAVATLKNPLLHHKSEDLHRLVEQINLQSSLHTKAIYEEGKKSSLLKVIIWPVGKFVYNYVVKLGFLDGLAGFIFAMLISFHSFLSWGGLWLRQKHLK